MPVIIPLEKYDDALAKAREALLRDGVVIYPTDTVYGLGANALSEKAVQRVLKLKKREAKPIAVIMADLPFIKRHCFTRGVQALLEKLLPGPYTVILKSKRKFPAPVAPAGKVGVRVPDHHFARTLCRDLGAPITATSANFSGGKSPASLQEVDARLLELVDVAVDGGKTQYGEPSTVVDLTGERPVVLRKGAGYEELPFR